MELGKLLGVELPVLQAPMAGVQGSRLAIAVSNAGGLGALPGAMLSPDKLRGELAAIRAGTAKPFNVNFFCHLPPVPAPEREAAWRRTLRTTTSWGSRGMPSPRRRRARRSARRPPKCSANSRRRW